ncbi:hypothetical protein ACC846_38540, partial [Rhizobium ruizarguesonis]
MRTIKLKLSYRVSINCHFTRSQHVYFSSGRRVLFFGALAQAVENRAGMQLSIPVARSHEKFEDIEAAHIACRRPD